MDLNIRAGMRVLYKQGNSNWMVGTTMEGNAELTPLGLYIPIKPINCEPEEEYHWAEINQIYTDGKKLDDWMKNYLLTKDEYIQFLHSDDFHRSIEAAWVSDGEYYYYPVSKYSDTWVMKQPFDYIIRND